MKIRIILFALILGAVATTSFAEEKVSTSRDLKVIAAEPKTPDVPNEIEIIREVIKTRVFEDEIEPIIEIKPLDETYLDELNAAFNTKDYENIKAFINLSDFFVMDWNQNIISTAASLENKLQDLQGRPGFDGWRNSVKLNFIKPISPAVSVISTEVKIAGSEENIFHGSAIFIVEFMDDSWRVIGAHISKIPEKNQTQMVNLNVIHYLMLIAGVLIGAVAVRLFNRNQRLS